LNAATLALVFGFTETLVISIGRVNKESDGQANQECDDAEDVLQDSHLFARA
jgi:hypothetical protein